MGDMNRISATLPPADVAAVVAAIQTIQTKLPFLVGLSAGDRQTIPRLGDKSDGFHDKCKGYMGSNPEFLPGFVNPVEVGKDQALLDQFAQFWPLYSTQLQAIDDTMMVLGSELYMADLAYYQNVREAAKRGIAGAQPIYDDLSARFPGRPKKPKVP